MLLDLPDELLGLVLDATEIPMGLRLASKRFSSMPRGKAKVRELQRRALRTFGIKTCHRKENWLKSLMPDRGRSHLFYSLAHYISAPPRALTAAAWGPKPSDFHRNAFIAFTAVEADKVRSHLVAQRLLLHGELIEGCRAWFMELGQSADELDVDELQEYVENQMEVPAGSLSRAKKLLEQAVHKVVQRLNEDAMRKCLMAGDPGRDDPGNFLTGPDETWWRLTGSDE